MSSRGGIHAYASGSKFTQHEIIANDGEDIAMKIMSLSQKRSHAICILSGNGKISSVTLRHSMSSGGTLTHEGKFELCCLSGSFVPTGNGVSKSRCGGISVCLIGPDGQLIGGELAGMLVAGGQVQVKVGSFLPGKSRRRGWSMYQQQKDKPKKQRLEHVSTKDSTHVNHISGGEINMSLGEGSVDSSADDDEAHLPEFNPTQLDVGDAC